MRISVIVPVFNNEDTVLNALDSISAQTRLDLIEEIIIVNDGSTDASLAVIKGFQKQNLSVPIVVVTQVNQGVSAARNAGIKVARGDWIALLDADDVWLPLKFLTRKITELYKVSVYDLCVKWFPVTPSVLFRRRIFEEIGGFNEEMHQGTVL